MCVSVWAIFFFFFLYICMCGLFVRMCVWVYVSVCTFMCIHTFLVRVCTCVCICLTIYFYLPVCQVKVTLSITASKYWKSKQICGTLKKKKSLKTKIYWTTTKAKHTPSLPHANPTRKSIKKKKKSTLQYRETALWKSVW